MRRGGGGGERERDHESRVKDADNHIQNELIKRDLFLHNLKSARMREQVLDRQRNRGKMIKKLPAAPLQPTVVGIPAR